MKTNRILSVAAASLLLTSCVGVVAVPSLSIEPHSGKPLAIPSGCATDADPSRATAPEKASAGTPAGEAVAKGLSYAFAPAAWLFGNAAPAMIGSPGVAWMPKKQPDFDWNSLPRDP